MERTLILVKPDGVQRGLTGEILSRFERRGLKIRALKMLTVTSEKAEEHYQEHKEKPFFPELVGYITSGPVVAAILEGPGAVAVVRQMMGTTDPQKSPPGTIRGDFALTTRHNIIHGSDSLESAEREISLFFSPDEIK